jgi:hypothetical protein
VTLTVTNGCGWSVVAHPVTVKPVPVIRNLYLPLIIKGEPPPQGLFSWSASWFW